MFFILLSVELDLTIRIENQFQKVEPIHTFRCHLDTSLNFLNNFSKLSNQVNIIFK